MSTECQSSGSLAWRRPARLLSLDGGGIRGIITACLLREIEERCQQPIASLFDLIVGTSTGGILALGLVAPNERGDPRWSADHLRNLFLKAREEFFVGLGRKFLGGVWHERYSSQVLYETLARYGLDCRLSDAVADVLVTSYSLSDRELVLFTSMDARAHDTCDYLLRDVGRATTAAPTFFEPFLLNREGSHPKLLVDGGLSANNPAMCGVAEMLRWTGEAPGFVVSIGTGRPNRSFDGQGTEHWGLAQWARPIVHLVQDGSGDAVHRQLSVFLSSNSYFRLQADLVSGSEHLDDTSSANLEHLIDDAERFIHQNDERIDQLCELLVSPT